MSTPIDENKSYLIGGAFLKTLQRIIRKVDKINGPGVTNMPEYISINPSRGRVPTISRAGVPVRILKVHSIQPDYLVCRAYNETNGSSVNEIDVYVAKPPELRQTPYDGETIGDYSYEYTDSQERTSTRNSDSDEEAQIVLPPYDADLSVVYAISIPVIRMEGADVSLLDLNVAGRVWAMDDEA